jgi:hypothetical protein
MKSQASKLILFLITLLILASTVRLQAAPETPLPKAETFRRWGAEAQAAIDRNFWLPERTLYAEK